MVGWLTMDWGHRYFRCRYCQAEIAGLPLLRAEVPMRGGIPEGAMERRIRRTARRLAQSGCRRVLAEAGFPLWPLLEQRGLRRVEAEDLCRAMAAELALARLAQGGRRPALATVELRCARVDRAVFRAAEALCPQVKQLILHAPVGGAELGDYLRGEYGVAAVERGKAPDAIVCFSPTEDEPAGALRLYGPRPDLGALGIAPRDWILPADAEALALTALLWEEGRLPLEEIAVIPT